mgnify:CR=1 FL=1
MPVATAILRLSTTPFIFIFKVKSQFSSVFLRNPDDSPPIIKAIGLLNIISLTSSLALSVAP